MARKVFFCIFIVSVVVLFYAYAGEVKLTTYYPAPYGEYKRVVAGTLGIGDNNGSGTIDGNDAPDPSTKEGEVWIKGNVGIGTASPQATLHINGTAILIPRAASDPTGGINGMLYYNTATNKFRGYEGGQWKDLKT